MRDESGLKTVQGKAIPLLGVEITGEVAGGHAKVRVRQRYRNSEAKPIEAVYTFPLPSDGTLIGFRMTADGRTCEGVVREREQAFREYDEAVATGHGAALLDQERPNVFTAQIGNLLPGEETVIEVELLQRLAADEGALRWAIPTLVAPRYIPGTAAGARTSHGVADPTDRVPDADRISPPIGEVKYGVRLDVVFDLGRPVAVESPSHAVKALAADTAGRVRVSFEQGEVALDRDIVLIARGGASGAERLEAITAHRTGEDAGVFALTVVPDLAGETRSAPTRHEVVFLIDVSGSMEGASLPEAQAALRLCLRHLREGDGFNVIAFSDRFTALAPRPIPFTQRTLEEADAWVTALHANGGTEIRGPLLEAVKQTDGVIVLLTDGQVGNEEEILTEILGKRGKARVLSFGIGTNVSDALLRGLARGTGGAVEMIHPGERIDEKVVAQFARATAPRVTDVEIKLEGVDAGELAPAEPRGLVDGEPWTLFGRYQKAGRGTAIIKGKLGDKPFHLEVPLDLPAAADRPHLPKLWAAERIRDLEEARLSGRRADAMKDRIVKLAVEHGIVTSYTSFVVVETRTGDRRATGQPETRVIPVSAPAGWAMFEKKKDVFRAARTMAGVVRGRMPAPMAAGRAAPPPPMQMQGRLDDAKCAEPECDEQMEASYAQSIPSNGFMPGAPKKAKEIDPVFAILGRQRADGLWGDLTATAKALLELLDAGITTAHALHGALVKKAIEAVIQAAPAAAGRDPRGAQAAIGAAWLLASGKRSRGQVEAAIRGSEALRMLEACIGKDADMRRKVTELL